MANELYTAPNGSFFRPVCPPTRWPECTEPYLPEQPRASRTSSPAARSAAVESAQILPVNLTLTYAGASTDFISSNAISFPFIVRGVYFENNVLTGAVTSQLLVALRLTKGTTDDLTAWNDGVTFLQPFGGQENFAIHGSSIMSPMWVPISEGGRRIICRVNQVAAIGGQGGACVLITPASDLQLEFGMQPPANPQGNLSGIPGCTRTYRPPIVGLDGLPYPGDPICLDNPIYDDRGNIIGYENTTR